MGGPKALMDVDGQPWWRIQHNRLRGIDIDTVWVLSPDVAPIVRDCDDAPPLIVESPADAPMFDSLLAGLHSLCKDPARGVFILPIDCPAPGPEVWRALSARGPVGVPVRDGLDGHPIFLGWAWVVRTILDAELDTELRRLDVLTRSERNLVPVHDPDVGVNLNTPEDVVAWMRG